jgi:DNA-binding transcriptional LysR family regulator
MLIDQALVEVGVAPNVAVQTNSMSLQMKLVGEGHGWTILPAAGLAAAIARGDLSAAPIRNPSITRTVARCLARSARTPPAVKAVAAELIGLAKEAVEDGVWPSATWLL